MVVDMTGMAVLWSGNNAACYLILLGVLTRWRCRHQGSNSTTHVITRYIKALMRRATAFEEMDDPEHALADAKKVGRRGVEGQERWLTTAGCFARARWDRVV